MQSERLSVGSCGRVQHRGRVTSLMPHPGTGVPNGAASWAPREWGEDGGWTRLFRNARVFAG